MNNTQKNEIDAQATASVKQAIERLRNRPLEEAEAKEFISKELNRLLLKKLLSLGLIFGIANVAAFFVLVSQIAGTAKDAAKESASTAARNAVEPLLRILNEEVTQTKLRANSFTNDVIEAEKRLASYDTRASELGTKQTGIQSQLAVIEAQSATIIAKYGEVANVQTSHISDIVKEVNKLTPENKNLLSEFAAFEAKYQAELVSVKNDMQKKVETGNRYVLRAAAAKGNEAITYNGTDINLNPRGDVHSPEQYWIITN